MWLVIRLVLVALGFAIRQRQRRSLPASTGRFQGVAYFETRTGNSFTIGMQRRSPTWVRLHAESAIDRLCKWLGIANELQTGDPGFDDKVYVTCDHPHVHAVLRKSRQLRNAVVAALDGGFSWIRFDGATVRMCREVKGGPEGDDLRLLKAVWAAAGVLDQPLPSRLADRFLWKALVIEGAIWSLAGYAIGAWLQYVFADEVYHLWDDDVAWLGGLVAAATFVVLLAAIVLWMRGSSRGHRVIVESAFVLVLGLPLAANQLVSDSNRALDTAPSLLVQDTKVDCEHRMHRGKGGRISYTYHLHLAGTRAGPEQAHGEAAQAGAKSVQLRLPAEIRVPEQLCRQTGTRVDFEIGPGRWGIPWYREIKIGEIRWRPL
jgi:hypothetical protein